MPPHRRGVARRGRAPRGDADGAGVAATPADSAIYKVEGLTPEQLRWRPAPTANSLGVLVVHLAYAERLWLRGICAGEPMDMGWRSHMFELPYGWGAAEVVAFYRAESALADAVLDRATSLDLPSPAICAHDAVLAVYHLIEEMARHVATWTSPWSSSAAWAAESSPAVPGRPGPGIRRQARRSSAPVVSGPDAVLGMGPSGTPVGLERLDPVLVPTRPRRRGILVVGDGGGEVGGTVRRCVQKLRRGRATIEVVKARGWRSTQMAMEVHPGEAVPGAAPSDTTVFHQLGPEGQGQLFPDALAYPTYGDTDKIPAVGSGSRSTGQPGSARWLRVAVALVALAVVAAGAALGLVKSGVIGSGNGGGTGTSSTPPAHHGTVTNPKAPLLTALPAGGGSANYSIAVAAYQVTVATTTGRSWVSIGILGQHPTFEGILEPGTSHKEILLGASEVDVGPEGRRSS